MRLVALGILAIAMLTVGSAVRDSSAADGRLIRVFAYTAAEQGETEETSDVLFTSVVLRGDLGNQVGRGDLRCEVALGGTSHCDGTYVFERGKLMVQGTRQRQDFYVLAVVGGTGVFSGAGGTLIASTISLMPNRDRLLFSLEP